MTTKKPAPPVTPSAETSSSAPPPPAETAAPTPSPAPAPMTLDPLQGPLHPPGALSQPKRAMLRITSLVDGYERFGIVFSREPGVGPADRLEAAQIRSLKLDPTLTVEEFEAD